LLDGLEAGADNFISKPPDRHELRARLFAISRLNRYRKLLGERQNLDAAHQQLLKAYDKTIEGWSRAMDLRDKETEGHAQRVTDMTLKLAKLFGVQGEELIHIQRGALLHDMGKLGVPDAILFKPDKLKDDEWDLMKQHPKMAYDMLYPIEYLRPALDIPYCHHEKWDGSGYPRGLKGEEIPFSARIFAVVDVWDALTSNRPYRAAWDTERALEYIQEQSGSHFDPAIVKVFTKIIQENIP
jgi:putative two-component system response regulator